MGINPDLCWWSDFGYMQNLFNLYVEIVPDQIGNLLHVTVTLI